MSKHDRDRWNGRYEAGSNLSSEPTAYLISIADKLPTRGKALDLAGGAGRNGLWLASRGMQVTIADISDVGLAIARQRAAERSLTVQTQQVDLELEPLPTGPWDLILSCHFLRRELFETLAEPLAVGGLLVVVQATVTNLERHDRPPRRFLLERGELAKLARLLAGSEVLELSEGWTDDGFHHGHLLARKLEC